MTGFREKTINESKGCFYLLLREHLLERSHQETHILNTASPPQSLLYPLSAPLQGSPMSWKWRMSSGLKPACSSTSGAPLSARLGLSFPLGATVRGAPWAVTNSWTKTLQASKTERAQETNLGNPAFCYRKRTLPQLVEITPAAPKYNASWLLYVFHKLALPGPATFHWYRISKGGFQTQPRPRGLPQGFRNSRAFCKISL